MPNAYTIAACLFGACAALPGQTPAAAPAAMKVYLLLKAPVAQAGEARDAFAARMGGLGVANLQFVAGASAARCEAPVSSLTVVAQDADVSGVLPLESKEDQTAPVLTPPGSAPPVSVPVTPPFAGIPQSMPMPMPGGMPMGGMPMGSGMSLGMAAITDFASGVVVRMLTPGQSCKIHLPKMIPVIGAQGGTAAFEVRASGNCGWQAVSTADWLKVKANVNGSGTVAVTFALTANTSGNRQAAILIQPVGGMPQIKGHSVQLVAQD